MRPRAGREIFLGGYFNTSEYAQIHSVFPSITAGYFCL